MFQELEREHYVNSQKQKLGRSQIRTQMGGKLVHTNHDIIAELTPRKKKLILMTRKGRMARHK